MPKRRSKIEQLITELCPGEVEFKELGEVVKIKNGKDWKGLGEGEIPVYGTGGIMGYVDTYSYDKPTVLIPRKGSITNIFYLDKPFWNVDTIYYTEIDTRQIMPKYFYYVIKNTDLEKLDTGSGRPSLTQAILDKIKIPIPPLPIQEEIVKILDTFTELEAREKQYECYRQELLTFDKETVLCPLSDVAHFMNGKGHEKHIDENGKYIVVNSKFVSTEGRVKKYSVKQISPVSENDILMVMSDLPNGKALAKCFYVDVSDKYTLNQRICALTVKSNKQLNAKFLFHILNRNKQLLRYDSGADQTNLRKDDILNIKIPVPPLTEQQRIVAILDKFDKLVNDISIGLPAGLNARRKQYEYYRDKLLTFKPLRKEYET